MEVEALDPAFADGWITEIHRVVKSGKEATVYLCRGGERSGEELVAAKVYRSSQNRMFRNESAYEEGGMRAVGRREKLAAAKRTAFGREVRHSRWLGREQETLSILHPAGARVPRPVAALDGLVLLSWIGHGEEAAPHLRQVSLEQGDARRIRGILLEQVELFLACNVVHGDLSEYNVLVRDGDPVVIDFPQAVDARFNRNARDLLRRDLGNLNRFFSRHDASFDTERFLSDLWRRWLHSELAVLGAEPDPALTWVDTRFARRY
jgi:RIO kinase 1